MHIHINFPHGRLKPGSLALHGTPDIGPLLVCPCLGRADRGKARREGNPDRAPTRPWGHVPYGRYPLARVIWFERRMKVGEAALPLPLVGAVGQEVEQARRNGRYGLYIHAGRGSRLVPTYGCIRLAARDFYTMAHLIGDREISVMVGAEIHGPD